MTTPKLLRGGSWYSNAWDTRSANRVWDDRDVRYYGFGFRLVKEKK